MNHNFAFSVASPPPVELAQWVHTEIEAILPVNDNGFVAPWWSDVIIERVASSDGLSLSKALVEEYDRIFSQLNALVEDGDLDANAAVTAYRLLWRAMFAGAVAPRISWHADAVVAFWAAAGKTHFFTIEAGSFSVLEECDGSITRRTDDIPLLEWNTIFPLTHGVH